jgi:hypothetical protein
MRHPRFGFSEIALRAFMSAPVVLALLISTTIASAQFRAHEPDADPERQASPSSFWLHNGSTMYLVASGEKRDFYYQNPRPEMMEAGARRGSLLFTGKSTGGRYVGTAYIYNPHCGRIGYPVSGPILDGYQRVSLRGNAPLMSLDCQIKGHIADTLELTLLKPGESAPPPATGTSYDVNIHVQHKNGKVFQDGKRVYQNGDRVPPHPIKPLPDGAVLCEVSVVPHTPKKILVPLNIDDSTFHVDNPHSAKEFVRNHSWVTLLDETLVRGELWSHVIEDSGEYNSTHEGWVRTRFLTHCETLIVAEAI